METAADLAKKYGFEQYLDKPAALNEAIFNLMLLQEMMQQEQLQRLNVRPSGAETISIKRTVHGRFIAGCTGDRKYRYAVELALQAGTAILPVFQMARFVKTLRAMGVPDDTIAGYCDSVAISDDTHCLDQD